MTGQAFAIDVHGMTKRFGERTVVDHIGLQVRRGEIFGFLGPNGSGKTTFIRMLCGLLRADEGSGTCLGYDVIRDSESIKAEVGYMTQRFSFYEDLSIAENLDFVARMFAVPAATAVTVPDAFTVATAVLVEFHVTTRPVSTLFDASRVTADAVVV